MFVDQKRGESKGIRLGRELVTSVGQILTLIRGQLGFQKKEMEIEEEDYVLIHYWSRP